MNRDAPVDASTPPAAFATGSADLRRYNRSFVAILGLVFAISFLKGFRLPNLWSATHFAFNYSQGFVRRGLIGEIARQLLGDGVFKYGNFVGFSFTIFVLVALLLRVLIGRALRAGPADVGFRCAALVFAASPALVFFIHTVGYFDYLGLLAVLAVLLLASRATNKYAIFYAVAGVGVVFAFIHEVLVVMFAPVMLFAMVCHIIRCGEREKLGRTTQVVLWVHAVVVTLFVFALSSAVSTFGTQDLARAMELRKWIAAHADYPTRPEAFEALARSSRENVTTLMPWYWKGRVSQQLAARAFVAFLPSYAFLLVYGFRSLKSLALGRRQRLLVRSCFVAASVAPLALNFVGWDWNRWNGIALIACFLCIATPKLFFPKLVARETPLLLLTFGLAALALSLAGDTELFDNHRVQFYPFDRQLDYMRRLLEQGIRNLPYL